MDLKTTCAWCKGEVKIEETDNPLECYARCQSTECGISNLLRRDGDTLFTLSWHGPSRTSNNSANQYKIT